MRAGALHRAGSNACLVPEVSKTDSAWERLRGLLGRPALAAGQGLWIAPCPSVHTIGMRYPLDLVFLDADNSVVRCVENLPAWRLAGSARAHSTVELPAGSIAQMNIRPGDRLEWRDA